VTDAPVKQNKHLHISYSYTIQLYCYKQREITQHFRLEPLMSLKQTYIDISHKQ